MGIDGPKIILKTVSS